MKETQTRPGAFRRKRSDDSIRLGGRSCDFHARVSGKTWVAATPESDRELETRILLIAWRVTADASLADVVVQETFLRILRVPAGAGPCGIRAATRRGARLAVRVALDTSASKRAPSRREERYAEERGCVSRLKAGFGANISTAG